jgi:hypothetical protein
MIFLIEYNRPEGKIVSLRTFDEADRQRSHDARLEMELDLNRKGVTHEVVLLEATSEEALRKTHGRYFKSITEIARSFGNHGR